MKEGDVVLIPLPQANGERKPRPAVLLKSIPPFGDYLVCGVSSQLRQHVHGLDELIIGADADFPGSGLQMDSLIRVGFLAVYTRQKIIGKIGEISHARHLRVLNRLAEFLISTKLPP